jgi:hypothetical protein
MELQDQLLVDGLLAVVEEVLMMANLLHLEGLVEEDLL